LFVSTTAVTARASNVASAPIAQARAIHDTEGVTFTE